MIPIRWRSPAVPRVAERGTAQPTYARWFGRAPCRLAPIEQTFSIGEADVEIARRLRLHESSPTAELRRLARDRRGTIIYFGYLFFPGQLVLLDFQGRS